MDEVQQRIHDLACAVDVAKAQQAEYKDRIAQGKEALAAEQREHDITRRQRDTLQTQCEDMQSERLDTANAMATTYADANAALKRELATTTQRLENSLKVTDEMVDTDMKDEMACMAEEVEGLKAELKAANWRTYESVVNAGNLIEEVDRLKESKKLCEKYLTSSCEKKDAQKREISILQESAETQAQFMQQVEAACKTAEAKVIEQRKEIEELKRGADMYICPSVDTCNPMHICGHREPHTHKDAGGCCNYRCRLATGICVKVNTCKECATMREEIINRDAVILQYESRAEDREEIITALAKEIKGLNVSTPATGTDKTMFSGKAGEMKKNAQQRQCKYYTQCEYATSSHDTCENGGGKYCGVWRHNEATQ